MGLQGISSKMYYVSPGMQWVADPANITTSREMLSCKNDTMHEISQIRNLPFPKQGTKNVVPNKTGHRDNKMYFFLMKLD